MEPDVIRMHSSSPPPFDDTAEEEEDEEFGDFGGFSGVASSVSFGEFESHNGFGQSPATDTSPPGHTGSSVAASVSPDLPLGAPGRGSTATQPRSDHEPCDPGCSHAPPLSERILGGEAVRKPASRVQAAGAGQIKKQAHDCHGDLPAAEVLANGFAPFDAEETPAMRPKKRGPAAKPTPDCCGHRSVPNSAQVDTPSLCTQVLDSGEHLNGLPETKYLASAVSKLQSRTGPAGASSEKNGVEMDERSSRSVSPAAVREGVNNGSWGSCTGEEFERGDVEPMTGRLSTRRDQGLAVETRSEEVWAKEEHGSLCCRREGLGEERGTEDEGTAGLRTVSASISDDFASFCQAVSPDGLEDFGDFSVTGFAAPPFPGGGEPPTDRTDEEGRCGGFGQTGPAMPERAADSATGPTAESTPQGEFGEFGGPEGRESGCETEDGQGGFVGFPGSESFADFASASAGAELEAAGWDAFGPPQEAARAGGGAWAAFHEEHGTDLSGASKEACWDAAVSAPPSGCPRICRRDSLSVSLSGRLERLFRLSFPEMQEPRAGEEVPSLRALLEPPGGQLEPGEERSSASHYRDPGDVWWRLQDVHDALGLRFQWGGSHSNKALLCSLGVDAHDVLFAGHKKQHVILPMYAASLGMLEPTKDPTSPPSAAEKITSTAQAPSSSPETSTSPESSQEALLPIQLDWRSSGLTNPLDGRDPALCKQSAVQLQPSGTSCLPDSSHLKPAVGTLINLPGTSSHLKPAVGTPINLPDTSSHLKPAVGTTSCLPDSSSHLVPAVGTPINLPDSSSHLKPAVGNTSSSSRKPRWEEALSEEAAGVMGALPDLSFMQARVLMFPATLT